MKKVAVITMSRNDDFFLKKWIEYYGDIFGKEHLYVFLDGEDQKIPFNADNVNVTVKKHKELSRHKGDKYRINLLSDFAEKLFNEQQYDLVIGTDCDEFLIVDPNCNMNLLSYLSCKKFTTSCISALGVDVGHNLNTEEPLQSDTPILQQRSHAVLSSRYTKTSILSQPERWGSGFHRTKGRNFTIDKNLFLFHIGCCDGDLLRQKSGDNRLHNGWEKHLKRRSQTIRLTTDYQPKNGDTFIAIAQRIQSLCRPLYALNKPSMLGCNFVIKIPKRFRQVTF